MSHRALGTAGTYEAILGMTRPMGAFTCNESAPAQHRRPGPCNGRGLDFARLAKERTGPRRERSLECRALLRGAEAVWARVIGQVQAEAWVSGQAEASDAARAWVSAALRVWGLAAAVGSAMETTLALRAGTHACQGQL